MSAPSPEPQPAPALASAPAWLEALPDPAWLVALPGQSVAALNAAALRLIDQPAESLVGAPAAALAASPEDLAFWAALAAGDHGELDSEAVLVLADGARPGPEPRVLPARRSIRLLGAPAVAELALVVVQDRSAAFREQADREARLDELQATLESTADGLLVTGLDGRVHAFNEGFARMWAVPPEVVQRPDPSALALAMESAVADRAAYVEQLRALAENPPENAIDRIVMADGRTLERTSRPLWRNGREQGRVWCFRDLTERLVAEQRIEALEHGDPLTGLPNRRRFNECLEAALQATRADGGRFAVLILDLDRFRQINDTLGHDVGDRVLMDAAWRIRGCLRGPDILARLGGDQFALLLADADDAAADTAARRLLKVIAQPTTIDEAQFTLTCSIGIALAPAHGRTPDDLLRSAETAMRAVKAGGRANVRLHQVRAEVDRRVDMRLDHAMRQALVSGRFRLMFQPQLRLSDGALVGAEALLRWRDPELGDVPPARFVPVAEDSGFIVAIGDWVLAHAVRQAALWRAKGLVLPIAVNVSALQFRQSHFVDRVASVLALAGLPPDLLELELTESILVNDVDEALARLHALARLGVRMSIDDFGTGYSSLAYLKRFPIGKLKIDRSFIDGLPDEASDAGIVRAILQMAQALGLKVIAEGVETEAQRQFLAAGGCDEFQGWLYAPALDPLSFEQRVAALPLAARPVVPGTPLAAGAVAAEARAGAGARIRLVSG